MMAEELLEIDGSMLEGGGQLFRNALALSVLMRKPIRITKIRASRKKPGLAEQHLRGLQLLTEMSKAKVVGNKIRSREIEFWPSQNSDGIYQAPVETAASITLLMQVALPCALFATGFSEFYLDGGTNVDMAPQLDYMTEVFKYYLNKFGGDFGFLLVKRGYFPVGEGRTIFYTHPVRKLSSVTFLDRGEIVKIIGWSFVSGTVHLSKAYDMAGKAMDVLFDITERIYIYKYKEYKLMAPIGSCLGIILVALTSTGCVLGASALGKKKDNGEDVGEEAANQLLDTINSGACVDNYCQDQLIIFMALATGTSQIRVSTITMHTKTAIHIAELMTEAKFTIIEKDNYNIIECQGIGYQNKFKSA